MWGFEVPQVQEVGFGTKWVLEPKCARGTGF
jgi:hypothetical protein